MTRKPKDFKEEEVFEMLIKKGGGQNQWELRSTIPFNMDVVEQRFPAKMTFILNKNPAKSNINQIIGEKHNWIL